MEPAAIQSFPQTPLQAVPKVTGTKAMTFVHAQMSSSLIRGRAKGGKAL